MSVCEGTDMAVGVRPRVAINLSLLNLLFIGDHEISPPSPSPVLTEEGVVGRSLRQEACCYLGY